jgi:type II secretory pathway component PulF
MNRYAYIAKSQPYKAIEGEIEAESEQDAVRKLSAKGYFPVSIQLQNLSYDTRNFLRFSGTSGDILQFTHQLASLTESGVNILKSLNIITSQTSNKYLKAVLNDIIGNIKDGKALSESLAGYPNMFSNLYTSMIRSGEAGGSLEQTLKRLAGFLEEEAEFRKSLQAALIYPSFILAVSAATIIILLGFVIPRLVAMFEDMGQSLPLPTKILIDVSGFLRVYWWFFLVIIGAAVFFARRVNRSAQGKLFLDGLKLKLAIIGEIILKAEMSRLSRTLSLLLASGTPIVYSLDIAVSVVENHSLKIEVQKLKDQISGGASFSQGLKNSKLFPAFVTNIIAVGEETGTLEKSLMRIADEYQKDVDRSLKTLTRLLEPATILVMGLVVGFIVFAMLLPIFQINLIVR